MPKSAILAALFLASLLAAAPADAGTIFKCRNEQGKIEYSGTPCRHVIEGMRTYDDAAQPPPASSKTPAANAGRRDAPTGFVKSGKAPQLTLYYDPAGEPKQFSRSEMEAAIQSAAAAWSERCNVNLGYGGIVASNSGKSYVIGWNSELTSAANQYHGFKIMGVASRRFKNADLSPGMGSASLARTVRHEIGHLLGIGHIHEDPTSVMSYRVDRQTYVAAQLSASDYLSCNEAMAQKFGVPYERPASARTSTMTDSEALSARK